MTVSTLTVVPEAQRLGYGPGRRAAAPSWYWRSTDLTDRPSPAPPDPTTPPGSNTSSPAAGVHPPGPAGRHQHHRRGGHRPRPVHPGHGDDAGRGHLQAVRQPARLGLPVLLPAVQAGRLPDHPGRPRRRQRRPRTRRHASGRVPDAHRPLVRQVHTRVVSRHTCRDRRRCDCRPEPCHARRDAAWCPHGGRLVCYARHAETDRALGTPLCLDCYDHDGQVVWNLHAGELWRRTTIAVNRQPAAALARRPRHRPRPPIRLSLRQGRRDATPGRHPLPRHHPPRRRRPRRPRRDPAPTGRARRRRPEVADRPRRRARSRSPPTRTRPPGRLAASPGASRSTSAPSPSPPNGEITDGQVAAYLAKYATKVHRGHRPRLRPAHRRHRSTCTPTRTAPTPNGSSTPAGTRPAGRCTARASACTGPAGRPAGLTAPVCGAPSCAVRSHPDRPHLAAHRWAHMFGFGGHFLTKSPATPSPSPSNASTGPSTAAPSRPDPTRPPASCPSRRRRWSSTSSNSSAPAGTPPPTPCSPTPPLRWPESTQQAAREHLATIAA